MSRPLRVGHIALSFHEAASEQVELLLRSHGHEIERSSAPHKDMFASLGRGEVDVLVAGGCRAVTAFTTNRLQTTAFRPAQTNIPVAIGLIIRDRASSAGREMRIEELLCNM